MSRNRGRTSWLSLLASLAALAVAASALSAYCEQLASLDGGAGIMRGPVGQPIDRLCWRYHEPVIWLLWGTGAVLVAATWLRRVAGHSRSTLDRLLRSALRLGRVVSLSTLGAVVLLLVLHNRFFWF